MKEVTFTLSPEDLSLIDEKGNSYQPVGKAVISIGGGQPGKENAGADKVLSQTIVVR